MLHYILLQRNLVYIGIDRPHNTPLRRPRSSSLSATPRISNNTLFLSPDPYASFEHCVACCQECQAGRAWSAYPYGQIDMEFRPVNGPSSVRLLPSLGCVAKVPNCYERSFPPCA